ncbi:hypothetical protein CR513_05438, partial [Mucuna pruriens]
MATWVTLLGERRMKSELRKITVEEIRFERLDKTAIKHKIGLEIEGRVTRGLQAKPSPLGSSWNDSYNCERALWSKCWRWHERGTPGRYLPSKKDQPKGWTCKSCSPMRTMRRIGFSESNLKVCQGTLIGFVSEQVEIRGVINLETMVGTSSTEKATNIRFIVVNAPTSYNVILGKLALN